MYGIFSDGTVALQSQIGGSTSMYIRASNGLGQVTGKPEIRIYMRDRVGDVTRYNAAAVRTCLENMFCEVCERPDSTATFARVFWLSNAFPKTMFCPFLQPHDVIVYILKTHGQSLIKKEYGVTPPRELAGATLDGPKGWISEVYLDSKVNQTDRGLTYMIYHELLHNKRQEGDDPLHTRCGAGTTDIASGSIELGTQSVLITRFSECDKRLMAPVLGNAVKQFCK
jgi:hypothetical protein